MAPRCHAIHSNRRPESGGHCGRSRDLGVGQRPHLICIHHQLPTRARCTPRDPSIRNLTSNQKITYCSNASELAGREAEECFAPALRFQLDVDGRLTSERTEPIAADAREGKDGKPNAKLKLIAGLLDVGFDALKQRELQRRNRRMAAITAAALIVMAITTTLAITAVIARHDAERRQKQAEDLVGFMLGDLNDKLREVHRLDIMQAVDDKAMQYFESLSTKDVTDPVLEQRVIALEKIGNVRMEQGKLPAALESYAAASALAAELMQRGPNDVGRQAAYADSLKWIGQNHWFQGDLEQALRNFRAAGDILKKAVATEPVNSELAFRLAVIHNNVGHVLEARGDFIQARNNYLAMKNIFAALTVREPGEARWQSYLASADNNLGKIALQRGSLVEAIEAYRADQRIKASLFARDPNNHDAQESLLLSNAILGRTLALCGALPAALRYTEEAVSSARNLMEFDPKNPAWRELHGLYSQQLGRLLRQHGQLEAAAQADDTAVRTLAALSEASESYADAKQELGQSQLEQARLQLRQGDKVAAERSARAGLATLGELMKKKADDRSLTLLVAQGNLLMGTIAHARGDNQSAHDFWKKSRDLASPLQKAGSDPNVLGVVSSAMLLLGEADTAGPLVGRLLQMGYRDADFVELVTTEGRSYPSNTEMTRRIEEILK